MRKVKTMKSQFFKEHLNLLLILGIITLLVSTPFLIRIFKINEVYSNSEARVHTLDVIFYLRDRFGLTIADLSIKDVKVTEDHLMVTVHERYHGIIVISDYDDIKKDYIVRYDLEDDSMHIEDIITYDNPKMNLDYYD